MAHKTRPRMIYPGNWTHPKFRGLGCDGFVVWSYLVSQADDDGRAPLVPEVVASQPFLVLDGRPRSIQATEDLISKLVRAGLLEDYTVQNRRYYQLHDWQDFQKIRKDRYIASDYPNPQPRGNQLSTNCQPAGNQPVTNCQPSDNLKVKGNGNDNGKVNVSDIAEARDDDLPASPELGVRLARLLQAALRENHPNTRPTATAHDAEHIRQVATRLPEQDLEAMIRWAAADPFWASVLLARGGPGAKFREQFDAILTRWEASDEDRAYDRVLDQAERELREAGEIP